MLACSFYSIDNMGMINLNEYVERVWAASDRTEKIKILSEMIDVSRAKKLTKIKALKDIVHLSEQKLDSFAVNYSMSGMGMKVI
jgi:hypothetical protein